MKVIKRNGDLVDYDLEKISIAISGAFEELGSVFEDAKMLDEINSKIESTKLKQISVEDIQDIVEEALCKNKYINEARAYIRYRYKRELVRKSNTTDQSIKELLDGNNEYWNKENSNKNAKWVTTQRDYIAGITSKDIARRFIFPEDVVKAHDEGVIHIHDMDFYMLTETCCQIDLVKLFHGGFSTGHGHLNEPQSIRSYSALACIAIQANQNEMHGGQSVPNFDYAMAEGVAKTYAKEYYEAFGAFLKIKNSMNREQAAHVIDLMKKTIEQRPSMAHPEKYRAELAGYTFADVSKEMLEAADTYACQTALEQTDKETYQAMGALIHNLNTMNSRAGAQVPFSSINYGTDTSPEGRMAVKNLLLCTQAGLGGGETPIFPVQIFKVKDGINYKQGDPNYDLFRLAIKTSAKRLFPNFSFIDAPYNLQYYKEGDYNTEIAYMGCRTRVMGNVYDPSREVTCGRGNLSFTSINLPRLGIEAKGNIEHFYKMLDEKIDLVIRQLLHRFKIQCTKRVRNYPFLMGQGIWLDSDELDLEDSVAEILKHGTLSIGFIGLAETLKALTGKHHGESEASQKLGLEIIGHMRARMDEESKRRGLNFTLLATPAEGLSGRFVRIDQKIYGKIEGVTDREYYTNSFHVPVYYPIKAYKKIEIEAPYHALTNAGHISYVELDGDTCKNLEAFERIIKYMKEKGIGYGSINHPVDRDPVCGYTGVIDDVCPRCGRREGEGVSVEKLRELRKIYPNVPKC